MRPISIKTLAGLVVTTGLALALVGCKGDTGPAGANGTNGVNGAPGTPGINGTNGTSGSVAAYTLDAAALTPDQWVALNPVGTITKVDLTGTTPVVNFKITDANGFGVKNLDTFTQVTKTNGTVNLPNFSFYIAKLVPSTNGGPSKWVNYMVTSVPSTTTGTPVVQAPNAESGGGVLKGYGDGTYTYTFYTNINAAKAAVTAAGATQDVSALGDVTVDMNATTRMVIEFYGNARGYGIGRHANTPDGTSGPANAEMNTPINMTYDFVPAGGTPTVHREIVSLDTCNTCHTKFNYHGAHRVDPKGCVTCHTDQRRFGSVEATRNAANTAFISADTHQINGTAELDFMQVVHKLHMGESLQMTGYDFAADTNVPNLAATLGGMPPNNVRYPQSVANCNTCHVTAAATPDAGNWNLNPSRVACGACHDSVDFVLGTNHGPTNLAQSDDSQCAGCHNPSSAPAGSFIATYHVPVAPADPANAGIATPGSAPRANLGYSANSHTNSSAVAGNQANLPTGALPITWQLNSVAVSGSTITWNFTFLNGTTPVKLNAFDAVNHPEIMDGFAGAPTLYLAFAAPQDGIAAPVDYNGTISIGLRKLWRGGVTQTVGGVTTTIPGNAVVDNGDGTYTATYNQATVPTGSGMITGGIGYAYGVVTQTQLYGDPGDGTSAHKPVAATAPIALSDSIPLTQINLPAYPFGALGTANAYQGGLSVVAPNVWKLASGMTPRRAIVSTAKCQSCHENLGVFTDAVFHAGQRNNAETCTFCHNANSMDAGWNYNAKNIVHSLHASSMRTTPYTWQSSHTYFNTTYPAVLNNCEACHVPGSYDFATPGNANDVANMLWDTNATGTGAAGTVLTDSTMWSASATYISPVITAGAVYGNAISYNTKLVANTNGGAGTVWPSVGTPVATITSVPVGGSIEADPTTLVTSPLTAACMGCHDASSATAHMKTMGGYIAVPRSTVVTVTATAAGGTSVISPLKNGEACLTCHGTGALADIHNVHFTF